MSDGLLYTLHEENNESNSDIEFNCIRKVLEDAFTSLPAESQKMLILADGLELNQRDIGKVCIIGALFI